MEVRFLSVNVKGQMSETLFLLAVLLKIPLVECKANNYTCHQLLV